MEVSNNKYSFYKKNKGDKVWWLDNSDVIGEYVFSLDKKKTYNLFSDYPEKLSVKEWLEFNAENEYWRRFFEDRNIDYENSHEEEIESLRR